MVDASHPERDQQMESVERILADMELQGVPRITLMNKWDSVPAGERVSLLLDRPDAVPVSALTGAGLEKATALIERMMFELGPDYSIKVVTGDKLVQFSAVSSGILRMTAKEFEDDVRRVGNEITAFVQKLAESSKK